MGKPLFDCVYFLYRSESSSTSPLQMTLLDGGGTGGTGSGGGGTTEVTILVGNT